MFWTTVDSPIDPLLLVGDETGLRELQMEPHEPPAEAVRDDDALAPVAAQLARLLRRCEDPVRAAAAPQGTAFQQKVWLALREIPFGGTTTYGQIAATSASRPRPGRSGSPTAATRSR